MSAESDRVVEVRQGTFQTKVLVKGDGPPVVCLHGLYGLKWDAFHDDLARRHTVYAVEFPRPDGRNDLKKLRNLWDVVLYHYDLFDELGLRSPAVVGHCFGGMVAAEVAATNPERVSKLVLIGALGLWRDDVPIPDYGGLTLSALRQLQFVDPEGPLAEENLGLPKEPEAYSKTMYSRTIALTSAAKFTWPIPDKGLQYRLPRITASTLLVWGKRDGLVPPVYAEEFAARLPKARIELIEGAAHMPQLEQRGQVSELVLDFLR